MTKTLEERKEIAERIKTELMKHCEKWVAISHDYTFIYTPTDQNIFFTESHYKELKKLKAKGFTITRHLITIWI